MTKIVSKAVLVSSLTLVIAACGGDKEISVCFTDQDCTSGVTVCDLGTHACVPMKDGMVDGGVDAGSDLDANQDTGADAQVDAAPQKCSSNESCAGTAAPFCDLTTQGCVACLASTDCPAATPICTGAGTCAACDTAGIPASACAVRDPDVPACGPAGACVRCTVDLQCAGGQSGQSGNDGKPFCVANDCVACKQDSSCGKAGTPICDQTGSCVACSTNAQCQAKNVAAPFCNTTSGTCQACLTSTDCKNANKPICDQTGTCVVCSEHAQCKVRNAAAAFCDTGAGTCEPCITSEHCPAVGKPICVDNTCVSCTIDAQCQAKLGPNPGICAYHQDGRCVSDGEAIYVRNDGGSACSDAGSGTSTQPFCSLPKALAAVTSTDRVLVLHGPGDAGVIKLGTAGPQITIVGKSGARIENHAALGIEVTAGDVFVRNVKVMNTYGAFVNNGVMRLDRVEIHNSKANTVSVWIEDPSSFEITNSILTHENGLVARLSGTAGKPQLFQNNTVVNKMGETGIYCTGGSGVVKSSLIHTQGDGTYDALDCVLDGYTTTKANGDPKLSASYRLTPQSPCVDRVPPANATKFDIEGNPRPQGQKSDCGAHELVP